MQLFKQSDSVVHHVCSLGKLILSGLNLLDREELMVDEMSEKREYEMAVEEWDDCLCQVVFSHFGGG